MHGPITDDSRRLNQLTVGAVGLGVVVRLVALGFKLSDPLPFADAAFYGAQGTAVREGNGFNELFTKVPTAEHGPLTQILIAPMTFRISDWNVADGQRITMTLLGIVSLVLFAVLARRLLAGPFAVLAVVVAAAYPNIWMHDAIVMSETVALVFVNAAMLLLVDFRERPSWWRAAGLGIAIGLAALARSELALLVVLAGGAAAWFVRGRSTSERGRLTPVATLAIVGAATAVTVAPWVVENLRRFDEPVYLSTNDGTTLLGAYCDDTFYGRGTGSWSVLCVFANTPSTDEDASVVARLRRETAFEYAGDHLERLPVVLLARAARTLDLYDPGGMVTGDAREDKEPWALWVGVVMWWVLAPLAVIGLVRMRSDDRLVIIGPIVIVVVTTLMFYGGHRLRVPLEPSVVLAAAYGANVLLGWQRSRAG